MIRERKQAMAAFLGRTFARLGAVVAAVLIASLVAPAIVAVGQEAEPVADATLRLVHASPGAPDVDLLLDGQPLIEGIAAGTATEYAVITAEEHRLQVVPTGQTADAAVVDETIDAGPGAAYVIAVFGLLNDIRGAVYDVDLSEIEPGNARVRTINLSPDIGAADLLETGGDEWFGGVELGAASDYRDVPPGLYSVDVRGEDDRVLLTAPDLTFEETDIYDVVVLGQVADDSLALLSLATRVSPPCAEVLGLAGAGEDACILFVHAAPDAPPVDVYLSDALVAENLEYGFATEYAAVASGADRAVRVSATGAPLEEAILDASFGFEPGQAYEILITGGADDLQLTITGTDLRPLPEGQARLRIVHASPDAGGVDLGVTGQDANLFDGVNFRDATNYVVLDAGEYPLEVRPGGEDMTVALQSDLTLEDGVVYDVVVLGRPADQSLRLLVLAVSAQTRTGLLATPEAAAGDVPLAETAEPVTEVVDPAATPAD
jgi:hypothetical protein